VGTQVGALVSQVRDEGAQLLLELESGMVGSDADAQRASSLPLL
jgi:hypothetical protein